MSSGAVRLFLALWPDAATRRALVAERRRWKLPPDVRPVNAARLHLTLFFIGAVPVERLADLVRACDVPTPPFQVELDGSALWPGGVAVLEPSRPPAALSALRGLLGERLGGVGLPVESRAFQPHVTLARHAQGARPPSMSGRSVAWPVRGHCERRHRPAVKAL